ncbi:helicase [Flammeovirgaceae bacterium 311]|nr:helicase [Flammeovirgaceae bacterium 311]
MSVFSQIPEDRIIHQGQHFFLVRDIYPVSPGHTLIISKEEKMDFFQLNAEERDELNELLLVARELIEKEFTPHGYNIGMNCGEAAGQTVMHFHCHIIPRFLGDMDDPRGGIRHCVEGRGYY